MKKIKILLLIFFLGFIYFCLLNFNVHWQTKDLVYQNIDEVPSAQTALVLGALVYKNEIMSVIFQDRVDTALELYQQGKVEKILVSGDHGRVNYDEVNTAKDYLLDQGVMSEDLFMDHAGFDTYDSVYRAKEIFQVESMIVVTQEFHLPRALFISKNLDVPACGLIADKRPYLFAKQNWLREKLANVKAWTNIVFKAKPKYLGNQIPIVGDSRLSWD